MWLLSPLVIVLALAVAAVVAGVMILVGAGALVLSLLHLWPLLMILMGVWMLVRPHHGGHHRPAWSGAPGPSGPMPRPTAGPVIERHDPRPAPAPPAPASPLRRELPIDLRVKVEQIRHKADVLLGYADRFPPFSHDLHLVRQSAVDYLPRTVEAYLALPGLDEPVVAATGNTALEELRGQLDLLDSKLDDIAQDLQREDVDRLLANRRFLEDRFRPTGTTQPEGA